MAILPVLVALSCNFATPGIADLERYLNAHPRLSATLSLERTGQPKLVASFYAERPHAWKLTLSGAGFAQSLVRNGSRSLEVNSVSRTYQEFGPGTFGRNGWTLGDFLPLLLLKEGLDQWKEEGTIEPLANGFRVKSQGAPEVTVTLKPTGEPKQMEVRREIEGQQVVARFSISKLNANPPKQVLNLEPPAGFTPELAGELRWPTAVGEQLPDVLARNGAPVAWSDIAKEKLTLLAFVQLDDPLSQQLLAHLSGENVVRVWVGRGNQKDLNIELGLPSLERIGLPGTPVLMLVQRDKTVKWIWQGFGPRNREKLLPSLKKARSESQS